MGSLLSHWTWLHENGFLRKGAAVVELGPQGLFIEASDRETAYRQVGDLIVSLCPERGAQRSEVDAFARHAVDHATMGDGIRTTYIAEILAFANIRYLSFDIYESGVPQTNTFFLDLNSDTLPVGLHGVGDIVTNFGTTEHIFNQLNSFKVLHDVTAVGGVMWHWLPITGYVDHGYFNYHPQFFRMIAAANGYEMLQTEIMYHCEEPLDKEIPKHPRINPRRWGDGSQFTNKPLHNTAISVALRKVKDQPFVIDLELATAAGPVPRKIASRYPLKV